MLNFQTMTSKEIVTSYKEALRYMENARDILKTKAIKEGGLYKDRKYVRMACSTAYTAALIATEAYLIQKGQPLPGNKNKRNNIDDHRMQLAKVNRKMLTYLNGAWGYLHCDGYYEGIPVVKGIQAGLSCADYLINAIRPVGAEAVKTKI